MNDSFDTSPPPADRPLATANPPQPGPHPPRRARRLVLWWLALSAVVVAACAICIITGLGHVDPRPLHFVLTVVEMTDGMTVAGLGDGAKALLALGGLFVAAVLVLIVPLVLLLALALLTLALVAGIALPLACVALVVVVATSPLWLIALLVWLLARRRAAHDVARSARMPA